MDDVMKKTVIVDIPMTQKINLNAYDQKYAFPIAAFLAGQLKPEDEIRCILLTKHSAFSRSEERVELFRNEMAMANEGIGAQISYHIIESEFEEEREVHEKLMAEIVSHIENDSHILADITFGPKDVPIIVFAVLNFAEKFLGCEVDNIIYGQGFFDQDNKFVEGKICELIPLYSLSSLTNTLDCPDPDKARAMLNSIVSL